MGIYCRKSNRCFANLANEHNSLIAKTDCSTNEKGEIDFRYQFYGHVSPPSNLKRASQESAEGSDMN